jgi:hypothetical protein
MQQAIAAQLRRSKTIPIESTHSACLLDPPFSDLAQYWRLVLTTHNATRLLRICQVSLSAPRFEWILRRSRSLMFVRPTGHRPWWLMRFCRIYHRSRSAQLRNPPHSPLPNELDLRGRGFSIALCFGCSDLVISAQWKWITDTICSRASESSACFVCCRLSPLSMLSCAVLLLGCSLRHLPLCGCCYRRTLAVALQDPPIIYLLCVPAGFVRVQHQQLHCPARRECVVRVHAIAPRADAVRVVLFCVVR